MGSSIRYPVRVLTLLFAGLTKVAAKNPNAWFQNERIGKDLAGVSKSNRMIAYHYTKLLNSMSYVNQAAALVLTTAGKARELGIDSDRFVYLHGFADANDIWNISERENFHSSPAMRFAGQQAMAMAGFSIR